MSRLFFDELDIHEPHCNLGVGSGSHGHMTGEMLNKVEEVLVREKPDWVLVYGDTNSTLAGALAASKLQIPVAHVEAGLRSFNRRMPEEINRVLTDHLSQLLFAPTEVAVGNLMSEGITKGVRITGDVMLDAFLFYKSRSSDQPKSLIFNDLGVKPHKYCLATVHRQENTDDRFKLKSILKALERIGTEVRVVLPLHPRTRKAMQSHGLRITSDSVRVTDPIGYLDMIQLEAKAALILTDSGGVQKEACFAGVPCVTLRDETEWTETVQAGVNFLAGAETDAIIAAYEQAKNVHMRSTCALYGDGHAAEAILKHLLNGS
jgi:UDP-N-acetylglucosamine 2-epimerase